MRSRARPMRVASVAGVRRETAMSGIVLRVAQVVGVLVLAGVAISIVVGFVQSLLGLALIVSIPLGFAAAWLGTMLSREPASEKMYEELRVRSLTGLGAEEVEVAPAPATRR